MTVAYARVVGSSNNECRCSGVLYMRTRLVRYLVVSTMYMLGVLMNWKKVYDGRVLTARIARRRICRKGFPGFGAAYDARNHRATAVWQVEWRLSLTILLHFVTQHSAFILDNYTIKYLYSNLIWAQTGKHFCPCTRNRLTEPPTRGRH